MVKKIFTKLGLLFSVLLVGAGSLSAQTTIPTVYTNGPTVNALLVTPSYFSFAVSNTNPYPIIITDLSTQHISLLTYTGGTVSNDGSSYTLWYNTNSGAGVPISIANNWNIGGSSSPITTTTTTVTPVLSNMSIFMPPNTTYRFALALDDTISVVSGTTAPVPASFTAGGVTLSTVGFPWGAFPSGAQNNNQAFNGSITFKKAAPRKPVATATPKVVCVNGTSKLEAKVDAYIPTPIITWYLNGTQVGTGSTYNTPGLITTTTYGVVVSDSGTVSDTTFVTVNVNDPKPPIVTGKTAYCINEPFIPVNVLASDPRWYYIASGGSPIPVTPTFNTTSANTATYYVSQIVNGCESRQRTRVHYTAAPKPSKPTVTTPLIYCENDQANQLSASGENLKWFFDEQGGIPSSIAPTPGTSVKKVEDFYVSQTIDGCESDRAKIEVEVTFRPNGLILPSDREICEGDSITISYYGSAFPTSAYRWEFPLYSVLRDGREQGPLTLRFDSAGNHTIRLSVGEGFCYSKLYEEQILVKAIPNATILAKDDVCLGQTDLISVDSYTPGVDTFIWNFAGGEASHFATDQGPYGILWYSAGTKIIDVTIRNNECMATIKDTIVVHEKPDARVLTTNYNPGDVLCSGDSLKLSAGTVEPGSSYSWSPARFFSTYSDIPVTYARVDFSGYIKLRVEDEFGCFATDSILIETKPCCEMTFPSAFSPNGDGRNDRFRAITLGNYDVKSFRVVNRYGQTIFEGQDIKNGWDGTLNGEPQDLGTYFYYIGFQCDGNLVEQSGEVILVR